LIFQPWDLGLAAALIKYGCKAMGVPHAGIVNYVVGRLVAISANTAQGVGGIVGIQSVGEASPFHLPKVGIAKDDGSYAEFGVVHSPTTFNGSSKNNEARDVLAATLQGTFL
jgi:hypothetical protein